MGRARAWLHLALMQKTVADYLKALLDRKDLLRLVGGLLTRAFHSVMHVSHIFFLFISSLHVLSEFYDYGAFMMEEEGVVMGGLLVGLNVIDANLCIKGEDLDSQVS